MYCGKYDWNGRNKNEPIPLLDKQESNGKFDSSVNQAWIKSYCVAVMDMWNTKTKVDRNIMV